MSRDVRLQQSSSRPGFKILERFERRKMSGEPGQGADISNIKSGKVLNEKW